VVLSAGARSAVARCGVHTIRVCRNTGECCCVFCFVEMSLRRCAATREIVRCVGCRVWSLARETSAPARIVVAAATSRRRRIGDARTHTRAAS
jgi:hypothetical protein